MSTAHPGDVREIRAQVLLLDGYCCRFCVAPAEVVTKWNPAKDYEISNLISLCRPCKAYHDLQVSTAAHSKRVREELAQPVKRPARFFTNPPGV